MSDEMEPRDFTVTLRVGNVTFEVECPDATARDLQDGLDGVTWVVEQYAEVLTLMDWELNRLRMKERTGWTFAAALSHGALWLAYPTWLTLAMTCLFTFLAWASLGVWLVHNARDPRTQ